MNEPQPKRRALNPWWIAAIVFVTGWVIYLAFFLPIPSGLVQVDRGPPADFGWRLLDLDGGEVPLSRFRGKTVFLNIWATWCEPCRKEMPSIVQLASRPELKDVAFLCVSVDDSAEKVKQFIGTERWPVTFLRGKPPLEVFATKGLPATFIISPGGTIAFSDVGARNWDTPDTIALLRQLVTETPSKR